jgi:hypothetical protein
LELEKRFQFTTKIIKALFLENSTLVNQRHARNVFSSSGGSANSAKDRDHSTSKGSSRTGSSTGGDTPEGSKDEPKSACMHSYYSHVLIYVRISLFFLDTFSFIYFITYFFIYC